MKRCTAATTAATSVRVLQRQINALRLRDLPSLYTMAMFNAAAGELGVG